MEFIVGALVGFVIAGLIGRAKFLQVQNQLRGAKNYASDLLDRLIREEDLTEGLSQELAERTR